MADEPTTADVAADDAGQLDTPTPSPVDPGGAHTKGYSADDPRPEADVKEGDPVPLAKGPDHHPAFHVPERDKHVRPTGRSEPNDAHNDRDMGEL